MKYVHLKMLPKESGGNTKLGKYRGFYTHDELKKAKKEHHEVIMKLKMVLDVIMVLIVLYQLKLNALTTEIYSVDEPSMCVYYMKMGSPAVCTEKRLNILKQKHENQTKDLSSIEGHELAKYLMKKDEL